MNGGQDRYIRGPKMNLVYRYQLFNLQVESQLEIPILDKSEETNVLPDVLIELGEIPSISGSILYENSYSQLTQDEYYLEVEHVANYYVSHGNYICIEPIEHLDEGNIILFLLGSILGVLLAQREAVIVHSSSVVIDNHAILFCGNCGAGKSTIATALRLKGFPLLSDDINLLKLATNNTVNAYKGFPQQKLCENALDQLNIDKSKYTQISTAKGKYVTHHLTCFPEKMVSLKAIYELRPCDVPYVEIREEKGKAKLIGLMKNLFRLQIRYYTGTSSAFMAQLIQIANNISYFIISRPNDYFCINEMVEKILINNQK